MKKKYKKVYSISLEPGYRNYTVKDLIDLKGKKKLTQIHVSTPEEARAAEEADIDILLVRVCPELKEIRKAAPKTFMTVSIPFIKYSSKEEIVRDSLEIIDLGMDSITCGSWNLDFMKYLNGFRIPFQGHAGLVPRKSTWIGGLRAVGKTANEAYELFQKFKRLEDAGAFSAECEVIPENVMGEISKRTDIVTVSLGSGRNADVMYLFMEDICGDTENPPRHSKAYGNLLKLRNEIKVERIKALKAFKKDSMTGKFPGKKQSSNLDKNQFEEFLNQLD